MRQRAPLRFTCIVCDGLTKPDDVQTALRHNRIYTVCDLCWEQNNISPEPNEVDVFGDFVSKPKVDVEGMLRQLQARHQVGVTITAFVDSQEVEVRWRLRDGTLRTVGGMSLAAALRSALATKG